MVARYREAGGCGGLGRRRCAGAVRPVIPRKRADADLLASKLRRPGATKDESGLPLISGWRRQTHIGSSPWWRRRATGRHAAAQWAEPTASPSPGCRSTRMTTTQRCCQLRGRGAGFGAAGRRAMFDALASPASSVPGSVVPRLGTAFAAMTTPVALVLDDVHLLTTRSAGPRCRCWLIMPDRSRLVLAGRAEPPLRTARLVPRAGSGDRPG